MDRAGSRELFKGPHLQTGGEPILSHTPTRFSLRKRDREKGGREKGRKERRKERRKVGRKEGRKEKREREGRQQTNSF